MRFQTLFPFKRFFIELFVRLSLNGRIIQFSAFYVNLFIDFFPIERRIFFFIKVRNFYYNSFFCQMIQSDSGTTSLSDLIFNQLVPKSNVRSGRLSSLFHRNESVLKRYVLIFYEICCPLKSKNKKLINFKEFCFRDRLTQNQSC